MNRCSKNMNDCFLKKEQSFTLKCEQYEQMFFKIEKTLDFQNVCSL